MNEKNTENKKKSVFHVMPAVIYLGGLILVNAILWTVNIFVNSFSLIIIGNLVAVSFIFSGVLLYVQQKEEFRLSRYLYFTIFTFVALFILCKVTNVL